MERHKRPLPDYGSYKLLIEMLTSEMAVLLQLTL